MGGLGGLPSRRHGQGQKLGPQPERPTGAGAGGSSDSDSADEGAGERRGEGQRSFLAEVLGARGTNDKSSLTRAAPAAAAQVRMLDVCFISFEDHVQSCD